MPGATVGTALNLGFPGTVVTSDVYKIASRPVRLTDQFGPFFGDPVVLRSDGTYSSVAAFIAGGGTFTTALFGGFAVREVKSNETYPVYSPGAQDEPNNWPYGDLTGYGFYDVGTPCDVLTNGTTVVLIRVGTPVLNGQMYVRVALNGAIPAGVVGGIEAASDGSNSVPLPSSVRFAQGSLEG